MCGGSQATKRINGTTNSRENTEEWKITQGPDDRLQETQRERGKKYEMRGESETDNFSPYGLYTQGKECRKSQVLSAERKEE